MARESPPGQRAVCRVPLMRHLALCAAASVAFLARQHLGVGNSVLWILGLAVLLNVGTALLLQRPSMSRVALVLSPFFGLGGWMALMLLTGGSKSPFAAGLLLEVVLVGLTGSVVSVVMTTTAAAVGLWFQHVLVGQVGAWVMPAVHTGFLLVTGVVTGYVTNRWEQSRSSLSRQQRDIESRLEQLEKELDDARRLGKMGENVARLAHGLKNTVHSLRGYARLIEPRLSGSGAGRELLDGLVTAIDGLEDLARATLGKGTSRRTDASSPGPDDGGSVVREVIRDVGTSFPEVRWSLSLTDLPPAARPSRSDLREILTIVVRNAAEAMHGRGEVAVEAGPRDGNLEIRVRDHGPGLPSVVEDAGFHPGNTTKPDGHGLGLFLARRLLEARGGLLSLSAAESGGTLCRIQLPLQGHSLQHEGAIRPCR